MGEPGPTTLLNAEADLAHERSLAKTIYHATVGPAVLCVALLTAVGQWGLAIPLGIGVSTVALTWLPLSLGRVRLARSFFLLSLGSALLSLDALFGGHAVDIAGFLYIALPFTFRPTAPIRRTAPSLALSILLVGTLLYHPWPDAWRLQSAIDNSRVLYLAIGGLTLANLGALYLNMQRSRLAMTRVLHGAAAEAQAASMAKSAFLANMSHELRTPLTAIIGYADLLAAADLPPELADHAHVIGRNSRHLLLLLTDILDLSKVEAGKMVADYADVSPVQVMAEAVSVVRVKAVEKGLELRLRFLDPMPRKVHIDALRLRQVVLNLLSNAVKFSADGSVDVNVRLHNHNGRGTLAVGVVDQGPGICPQLPSDTPYNVYHYCFLGPFIYSVLWD